MVSCVILGAVLRGEATAGDCRSGLGEYERLARGVAIGGGETVLTS